MEADFTVIAITPPCVRPDEVCFITTMLDSGVIDRVHFRHPDIDEATTAGILARLRPEHLCRISLHDHHRLAARFDGVGLHFNKRNPRRDIPCNGLQSAGVHSVDELNIATGLDYVFVSPVFDSISKEGYKANPDISKIVKTADMPAIALGGVTPDRFDELRNDGFAGGAMLGYLDVQSANLDKVLNTINKYRKI